ncbi:MAG: hypothetical protein LQ340_004823 [Diploschistes diacapsis]|nr:MAG: hypothetical protein LQ340_004823 [Diploschistes diacapsis]
MHPPPEPTAVSLNVQETAAAVDDMRWDEVAHVQLLQRYEDACTVTIVFAGLARQKSSAKCILLYPQEWDREIRSGQSQDRSKERSIRLLRRAKTRYGVSLRPADIMPQRDGAEAKPHPLATIFSLTEFKTILYLPPSGFVANAQALDKLLSAPSNSTILHFVGAEPDANEPLAFLVSPTREAHYLARKNSLSSMSMKQLAEAFQAVKVSTGSLLATSSLRSQEYAGSNLRTEEVLSSTAYVKFADPEILGPQFDIPRQIWLGAQPSTRSAQRIWEDLYEEYRGQRMGVCGLDLEPLPAFGTRWT